MDGRDLRLSEDLHLGRVIAVSACQAVALLESSHSTGSALGDLPLEMGTLVKMRTRVSIVYGMVTGLRVPLPSLEPSDKDLKLVEWTSSAKSQTRMPAPVFSAGCRPIRRWMNRCTSLRLKILHRYMRALKLQRRRSARFIKTAQYRLTFSSMSCSPSTSVLSEPRDPENPVVLPRFCAL